MPGTATTGSTKIALLDSKIIADLCAGIFYVDVTPSVYIGSGETTVAGANVKIINPLGVTVKDYGPDYEIAPDLSGGMDAQVSFNIPTEAGNYQYGQYKVLVQLFDGDGGSWVVEKTVSICEPDKNNKTRNYGSLSAIMKANCKTGKLSIIVDTPPNYKGKVVESQVNTLTLLYPTVSEVDPLSSSITSFAVQLYEGEYKLTGEICATYSMGDNVYVKVKYKIKKSKNVRCILDECCVFTALEELHVKIKNGCTQAEKDEVASITLDALRLLKMAQLAAECGEDPTEFVDALEKLLGCVCTCNCAEGTPLIPTASGDTSVVIEGCNTSFSTVGLTTTYTINNYEYIVSIVENGGALIVSAPTLSGCTKTQVITFDISIVYAQIRTLASASNAEGDFWASIVNKALRDIDPACLGISGATWQAYSLPQKFAALLSKICACCGCDAAVSGVSHSKNGDDVILSWTPNGSVSSVEVYIDGSLVGTNIGGVNSITIEGAADGIEHEYLIIPKCSSGAIGSTQDGTFLYLGCAEIPPPILPSDVFPDAECPFDLEAEMSPSSYEFEVHSENNTNADTLRDATALIAGVYYAFYKDADNGCYSQGVKFTVICDEGESCSAPQNLTVVKSGGNFLVEFQSAAYPPPSNSYTVSRRLTSDPDIEASYTTLGTPIWNAGVNRWQILDTSAIDNRLYTWKAQSNCGDSPETTPNIKVDFANITCPDPVLTLTSSSIEYDFSPAGDVNQYEVKLYDSSGTILLDTDTHNVNIIDPVPINGIFEYLDAATNYKIKIVAHIVDYTKTCPTISTATTA